MSWAWLDLVEVKPSGATLTARVWDEDEAAAGWLSAWRRRARPTRNARRVFDAVLDPGGAAGWLSLVLPPAGVRLAFDDIAVQAARRAVLSGRQVDALSTLLTDSSHFEGAVTVARGPRAQALLRDDPFARIFSARLLRVEAGILGKLAPPAGPVIERYGSSQPWPSGRFETE